MRNQDKMSKVGKLAVVTGASSELGCAIVDHLAEQTKCDVVATSRTLKPGKSHDGRVRRIAADLTEPAERENLLQSSTMGSRGVDILINCIGGGGVHEAWEDTDSQKWSDCYTLNVITPVDIIRKCLPSMRYKGWGRIVSIGSVAAIRPLSIGPEYAAAKAAVVSLTQSLANDLEGTGVTANVVSPGLLRTQKALDLLQNLKIAPEVFFPSLTGKLTTCDQVAKLIVFLCSEDADNITGHHFVIDGGYVCKHGPA